MNWKEKLSCLLHDPIHKPFILMALKKSHKEMAKELAEIFNIDLQEIATPDEIASAMERGFLPKGADKNKELQIRFLENGKIVHPFSGKKLDPNLKNLPTAQKIDELVREILKEHSLPEENKKKFLFLWRNLISILENKTNGELKKLWRVAPADTRLPDHSIFEHLKTTSAFWKTGKGFINHSLFLFTICPVQSFIGQARKTQDLYWGSFILSYLCWCGIKKVAKDYGPDCIIFPDIHGQPLCDFWLKEEEIELKDTQLNSIYTPTIPNRFLAVLPEKEFGKLKEIGEGVENAVRKKWKKIREKVFKKLKEKNPIYAPNIKSEFEKQINTFFEIYWIAVPFENELEKAIEKLKMVLSKEKTDAIENIIKFIQKQGNYPPNIGHLYSAYYTLTEKALGMRKSVRNFDQLAEKGRKCSICGERNVLFYRRTDREQDLDKLKQRKLFTEKVFIFDEGLSLRYLQPGEGLCGVCMVKRMAEVYFKDKFKQSGQKLLQFPSTAKIALLHWLKGLKEEQKRKYKQIFKPYQPKDQFHFDEQLYFEENLTSKYLKKQGYVKSDKEAEKLALNAKNKLEELKNSTKLKQTPYYALLMLDGDNMGKWLAGVFTPEIEKIYHSKVWENLSSDFKEELKNAIKNRLMTPALHAALSQALKNYALEFVKDIVEENGFGRLVYAGGDDVLAFVNLHALFDVMIKLRAAFSGNIKCENGKIIPDFTIEASGFVEKNGKIFTLLGSKATASCGVVIAHYKTPLLEVLKQAREMEKWAKDMPEKDAFAIAVLKHSGEIHKTRWKWQVEEEKEGALSIAKEVLSCLREEIISPHFVRVLRSEFEPLLGRNKTNQSFPLIVVSDIIKTELKRTIRRSLKSGPSQSEKEKYFEKVYKLKKLSEQPYLKMDAKDIDNFLSFLEILVFLKREMGSIKNVSQNNSS